MTEIAERPSGAPAHVGRINHWVNGRHVAGTSGRSGPVYNPATGELAREVDFASVE
jgi:malonate-semialdehyde dehydrogenase (acetylating)/methylmalonate-semialdehyde dehydrogenase